MGGNVTKLIVPWRKTTCEWWRGQTNTIFMEKISILGAMRSSLLLLGMGMFLCVSLFAASPAQAEDESASGIKVPRLTDDPAKLDESIESGLDHLFAMLEDKSVAFDQSQVAAMLDLVVNGTEDPRDIKPAKRYEGNGVCLRHSFRSDLDTLMRYFYNKDIPSFLLSPSSLRFSNWYADSEFMQRDTPLWEELDNLDAPVVTRGVEFESCTPDSFGEAYFTYDVNRLLVLLKYQGRNVLVSVSKQKDVSDVGRKGAIIDDSEWDYFYSGIEGINRGLIGWMDTFMYNSASVLVFVEQDKAQKQASLFLFKWLKAGWSGMNVVKRQHIYEGTVRYSRSLAKVLENPTLTPEELAVGMSEVSSLSDSQVDALIEQYAVNFERRFKEDPKLQKRSYAKIIADGGYAEVMDERARRYTVYLEKLKSMLGMDTLMDIRSATASN